MTASSITAGDMVEVDKKGRRFFALVTARDGTQLSIRPVDTRISYRQATSREVVGIWHANKQTRGRYAA